MYDNYELFIDVGNIGPDYQPAHAHSDTFNFELIKGDNPIFVDTGISTYEKIIKGKKKDQQILIIQFKLVLKINLRYGEAFV